MISNPEYLDNAATTKVDERVFEEMRPYFMENYGNASSNHNFGQKSKKAIDFAREQVSNIINCDAKEIIFTSGATESINLAIKGYLEANPEKGNHIITVKTEHKAVLNTCEYIENKGGEVTYLGVDENGLISLENLENSIKENTALIVVMHVNNEIGVIQPIQEVGAIANKYNIAFLCDGTQAIGKVRVNVEENNIDLLALSGHKINGPKGVGALYIKKGIKLTPLLHGGSQENGLRAGTYNTPLIVGLGKACDLANNEFDQNHEKLLKKRAELTNYFEDNDIGRINFKTVETAPHILSFTLKDVDAEDYLILNAKKIIASTGSACNSSIIVGSHVLTAINRGDNSVIRVSI